MRQVGLHRILRTRVTVMRGSPHIYYRLRLYIISNETGRIAKNIMDKEQCPNMFFVE